MKNGSRKARGGIRELIERNFRDSRSVYRIGFDACGNEEITKPGQQLRGTPIHGIILEDQFKAETDVLYFASGKERIAGGNTTL